MTERPAAIVFCERLDNESFCASVVRELEAWYEVRPCGPGWPVTDLDAIDHRGARFYLELDAASGSFVRPSGLERLHLPKFAWLIDTHKKPGFHRQISSEMSLTFHAMATWGHVLEGPRAWLPVHCDQELFRPRECEREWDVVFVGSQGWRAEPVQRIAERHGLRVLVTCTTGTHEKSQTAELYARSKVVFNRHVTNDLNFRVVEAMACGRALLTDAQWNGQYDLFEDERHYLLYKDEHDLERQLLRLLSDEGLRSTIEREAAALAQASHTTCARVGQLRQAIEANLGESRRTDAIEVATMETMASCSPARPALRFLVLASECPATVEQAGLAALCARSLASVGHEVVLAVTSPEPPLFPPAAPAPGAPKTVHLHQGPLPRRSSGELELEPAAALIHGLARLAEDEGSSFDAIVGEGALGSLVAGPLAERLGKPFVLALPRCEVRRRGNHLTREQFYLAELEHWGCDKAALVVTESQAVAEAIRRHYGANRIAVVTPGRRPCAAEPASLLEALGLGLQPGLLLLIGPDLSSDDAQRLLDAPDLELDHDVVLLAEETWVRRRGGSLQRLASLPASGPALAGLIGGASVVIGLDPDDPRLEEARALGARFLALEDHPRDLARLAAVAAGARRADRVDPTQRDYAVATRLVQVLGALEPANALR